VTIRGIVHVGTSDSAVTDLQPDCSFLTNSKVARKVFSTCNEFDECEITGNVNENNVLISVSKVRKIDTNKEPSVEAIKNGAYLVLSLQDDIKNNLLCVDDLIISNFHSFIENNETIWVYEFKLFGLTCWNPPSKEIGSGSVTIVKRNGAWVYLKQ
jgi:hypothetical protein